jgi:Holliday junction resolvase YEN1
MTPAYAEFLKAWKIALSVEFATDPHGTLGRKYKVLAATLEASTSFPNPDVLHAYAHPITSWSANYSPPAYQSWGLAQPELGRIASFCQLQFGWDAAQVSNKFSKLVYPGIALQSLLKVRIVSLASLTDDLFDC